MNKMKEWRLIKTIEANGAMQMAIDEAILASRIKNRVPNTLRFFTWNPPCLSIGYFQSLQKEVDVKNAERQGVDIVRRYTGGGAVFHDKELTYSLAVSEDDVPHDIIASYQKICSAITKGLGGLHINSEFKQINDIVVNGKKISGNAQTRKEGAVLQHGTILIDADVRRMFSLLKVPNEKIKDKMIQSVEERVSTLKKELGREVSVDELRGFLIKGFEDAFGVRFEESELTSEEKMLAERLCKEKYSKREWRELR